ncbi:hypothetical protein PWT90_06759 [Aphanocladium album]|nr:hypothetical protein PWT90_06759 [Aphanocladium album]
MADIPFRNILKSPRLFRFLVGPDKQEFFLHASLVASQSKVLDSLVNGAMKEAEDGCTTWENVSEDTFVRFAQYVYTGDYQGATPFMPPVAERPNTAAANGDPIAESLADTFVNTPKIETTKKKSKSFPIAVAEPTSCHKNAPLSTKATWGEFKSLRFYEYSGGSYSLPTDNDHYSSEYQEVFLSHARVHVVADYYMIEPLAQLSLDKLHTILCHFKLHRKRRCDVVTLLCFCYEEDTHQRLRDLVNAYAACYFKDLWQNEEFRQFFSSTAAFSLAIMGNVVDRMN